MKGCDRFLLALSRKVPDMVPVWELIIDEPVLSSVLNKVPSREADEKLSRYCELVELLDMDAVTWGEDQLIKKEGGNLIDEWGIIWKLNIAGIPYPIKGPLESINNLRNYSLPDPDAEHRLRSIEKLIDRFKGERAIVFLGHEVFEFSHYLVGGMDKLFRLYHFKPDQALELAEMISEYKLRVMKRAIKMGVNAVVCGDDYADDKGPFISPKLFDKFMLPYIKKAINLVHDLGKPFIKHTDGKLDFILERLIDAGIDALHPIEPAAGMNIAEVKRFYGNRICVIGNIDCRKLLTEGSPEEVTEVVKETIAKVAPGGGYILSSSNSIHPGVKPENFITMLKAARLYGRYPIDEKLIREYSTRNFYQKLYPEVFLRSKSQKIKVINKNYLYFHFYS
ncbi:MAG: uroporphyrinogen decarboxylase family protein [Nitrososphaerota archaeon]